MLVAFGVMKRRVRPMFRIWKKQDYRISLTCGTKDRLVSNVMPIFCTVSVVLIPVRSIGNSSDFAMVALVPKTVNSVVQL